MTLFDVIVCVVAPVLYVWAVNFSISAHFQENDNEMWVQHIFSALLIFLASLLIILSGG